MHRGRKGKGLTGRKTYVTETVVVDDWFVVKGARVDKGSWQLQVRFDGTSRFLLAAAALHAASQSSKLQLCWMQATLHMFEPQMICFRNWSASPSSPQHLGRGMGLQALMTLGGVRLSVGLTGRTLAVWASPLSTGVFLASSLALELCVNWASFKRPSWCSKSYRVSGASVGGSRPSGARRLVRCFVSLLARTPPLVQMPLRGRPAFHGVGTFGHPSAGRGAPRRLTHRKRRRLSARCWHRYPM